MAWPQIDEALLEQLALTRNFKLGRPTAISVTAGGAVLFTRTPPRSPVGDLYVFDAATGETRRLVSTEELLGAGGEALSMEERARRERARKDTSGVVGFDVSPDGQRVLVPLSGRLFVVDLGGGWREMALPDGPAPIDARFSPDGERVSFVRDGDLYVVDEELRRLTVRPSPEVEHAVAEFVAQEEMDRMRGYWWSPDGKSIAYQRSDVSGVDVLSVADPEHPDRPVLALRYPRPGRPNADVTLWVMPAAGGAAREIVWDRARWPYLASVEWERGPLTLVVQDRRQMELVVLVADTETGATRELLRERDDTWLDLDQSVPRWIDGERFLWSAERGDGRQLELRRRDGSLERVVMERGYRALGGIDLDAGALWVLASEDARGREVLRVPLDGGAAERRSQGRGVHEVWAARRGGVHVVRAALDDGSERYDVWRDGSRVAPLPSVAEEPPYHAHAEWLEVDVEGRPYQAVVTRPRGFSGGGRLPVLVYVYGGPTHIVVDFERRLLLADQVFADAGFIVVRLDGRGTPGRGRDFHRAVAGDLATIAVHDQAEGLRAVAARVPEIDLGRAGIMGWSFGGYLAALAVLLRPDVFHAGIAGAPVTEWRLYDTHYTERYLKLPDENPEGYARSSVLEHASKLSRPLLLIHGTTDDNVHFAHTIALADRLFRAGKPFELLPLSGLTHMVPDANVRKALVAREVEFFRRHLGRV